MLSLLFLVVDAFLTGILVIIAYKLGQWGKESEMGRELDNANFRVSKLTGELHLMWDIVQTCAEEEFHRMELEEKTCDHCLTSKPLTDFHSHPTCKCCRKGVDASRYKAKKEVSL